VDNELEVIRHQMEEKRASLADKLDALQEQVLETVHEATSAVTNTVRDVTDVVDTVKENIQETVDTVKGKVEETVESVKETFNVSEKIREHPWVALGGGFAVGLAGGIFLGSSSRGRGNYSSSSYRSEPYSPPEPVRSSTRQPQASESSSGLTSQLGTAATEALNTVKGMAIGTLMGVLNELVGQAVPATMKSEVEKLFGDLNSRLGGKELYKLDFLTGSTGDDATRSETNAYGNPTEMGRPMGSARR
jgi:ElaB/YqjD/DUF883 family membrane-anchored ribosome-binding protein